MNIGIKIQHSLFFPDEEEACLLKLKKPVLLLKERDATHHISNVRLEIGWSIGLVASVTGLSKGDRYGPTT
jgi:hypothetical protein